MQVLADDQARDEASRRGVPWASLDDELAWREALRVHVAAEGSLLRRSLVDRTLRWHGLPPDEEARERVNTLLDDLDAVGDLFLGDGGLVGAAPVRAARVRGSSTVLLLGSVGTDRLSRALPGEAIERRRVRRATLQWHDHDALARALEPLGATVTDADAWAGLDRAPATLDAWWSELAATPGSGAGLDTAQDPAAQVYVCRDGRSRWRAWGEVGRGGDGLVRARQPGGWFRFVWCRGGEFVPLRRDDAVRTALAIDARSGISRVVTCAADARGAVEVTLPTHIPRAEYRLLLGTSDRATSEEATRFVVPRDVWPTLEAMLRERLGLVVSGLEVLR